MLNDALTTCRKPLKLYQIILSKLNAITCLTITLKSSVVMIEIFSSLDKYPTLCKPKSLGPSYHPDKVVFPFGSQILQMSSSSESILDHIADYLKFISGAQSFWFMLNTSYNHDCHPTSRFRLELNNYKVLLVVASLALYK